MAREGLEYSIRVKDEGKGVLRAHLGELSNWSGKATRLVTAPFRAMTSLSGMALQANIRSIGGLANRIDDLIDSGSRLSVVTKSFSSLTQTTGDATKRMARDIRDASNGALTLAQSMQVANRALASGMNVQDIKTTLDFVSRKAFTTNKDMGQAIDTMITGLSRGSTLFLDDYGILVDGIDQVRRDYDAMKGIGAFDSLGPAAQKAETIRAAMKEMRMQMERIGVTGQESAFQWSRIKSSISDGVNNLTGALSKTDRMQSKFEGLARVTGGIADALGGPDQDKAFDNLVERGKELLGGMMMDTGELLAHGAMKGLNAVWPRILSEGQKVLGGLGLMAGDIIERLFAHVTVLLGKSNIPFLNISPDAMNSAQGRLAQSAPLVDLSSLNNIFQGGGQFEPFSRSRSALGGLADDFGNAQYGRDIIERMQSKAASGMSRGDRLRLERELGRARRELSRYEQRNPMRRTGRYMSDARDRFRSDTESMPELSRLSRADRSGYINKYAQEAYQAEGERLRERVRLLDEQLNPGTSESAPTMLAPASQPSPSLPGPTTRPAGKMPGIGGYARVLNAMDQGFGGLSGGIGKGNAIKSVQELAMSGLVDDWHDMSHVRYPYVAPGVPSGLTRIVDSFSNPFNKKWMTPREKAFRKVGLGVGALASGPYGKLVNPALKIPSIINTAIRFLGTNTALEGGIETVMGRQLSTPESCVMAGSGPGGECATKGALIGFTRAMEDGATWGKAIRSGASVGSRAGLLGALGGVSIELLMHYLESDLEKKMSSTGMGDPGRSGSPVGATANLDSGTRALEGMTDRFARAARRSEQAASELAKVIAEI